MITADEEEVTAPAAVTARPKLMFKYSEYVDIGEHDDLETERESCTDPEHFHGWCRLPNQFQHADIREKANAAKARKLRQLKDPETNAGILLAQEMESLNDPVFKDTIIEELMQLDWAQDYLSARREVNFAETGADEDGEPIVRFKDITQDEEEYRRLRATQEDKPPDDQSEEYKLLGVEVQAYHAAIEAELSRIQHPKREALKDRDFDSLFKVLLNARIASEADKAFLDVYNQWTWVAGTYSTEKHPATNRPHKLRFTGLGDAMDPKPATLAALAPEVLDLIKSTFTQLSVNQQRGAAGN